MALRKEVSTNDPFEALYLRQADPTSQMTVNTGGAHIEWSFEDTSKITKAIQEIHEGNASIKIADAEHRLRKELGVIISYHGKEPERKPVVERGRRSTFTDEMKKKALALKDQGLKVAEIQRQLEKEYGGPAYQTLVKFLAQTSGSRR